jgi:hypothetical protein
MTRRCRVVLTVLAAACVLPVAIAVARPPARLLVYAQEWSLWASRPSVPAGRVVVQLWNRGQDAHDLRVRRVDARGRMSGGVLASMRTTLPGTISTASWHLRAGRYELYCAMPGHMKLGMRARLTVR